MQKLLKETKDALPFFGQKDAFKQQKKRQIKKASKKTLE
jgi:hypothetical protein